LTLLAILFFAAVPLAWNAGIKMLFFVGMLCQSQQLRLRISFDSLLKKLRVCCGGCCMKMTRRCFIVVLFAVLHCDSAFAWFTGPPRAVVAHLLPGKALDEELTWHVVLFVATVGLALILGFGVFILAMYVIKRFADNTDKKE
jgi:hypothetical protein